MESSSPWRPETSARIKMCRFSFLPVLDSPDRSELRISCRTAQRHLHGGVYWRLRETDTHSQPSTFVSLESIKVAGDSLNQDSSDSFTHRWSHTFHTDFLFPLRCHFRSLVDGSKEVRRLQIWLSKDSSSSLLRQHASNSHRDCCSPGWRLLLFPARLPGVP